MKEIIETADAPEAIGPYSQAVKYNGIIYCSGQIPLDPETMKIAGNDIETQTRQVLENIGNVLNAADSGFSHVLKCTIFLIEINDFNKFNKIYNEYFDGNPPARETVSVKALPKKALVEISCVAF